MRIIRSALSWTVVGCGPAGSICLRALALRHGFRVSEVCVALECSERHLYEVFVRDVGLPPKEWFRQDRILLAREWLRAGREVDAVSEELGFATSNSLRREFRGYFEMSPLQFQKKWESVEAGRLGEWD